MFSSNTSAVSGDAVYIEDVFSTWLYTGNGANRSINNGIDLAGKGGLVWTKSRSNTADHSLTDTATGANKQLITNATLAQQSFADELTAFNSNGYNLGNNSSYGATNVNNWTYASWTFRKQAKFFDVLTYTGNGGAQTISHSLGSTPGCIIIKKIDSTTFNAGWAVYHRSLTNPSNYYLVLNTTAAETNYGGSFISNVGSTSFDVNGASGFLGLNGSTYVAYLFAHNAGGFGLTGTDNVISCGSFTTDGSGNATINLGYEPQWIVVKATNQAYGWEIYDTMRGIGASGTNHKFLYANTSAAEGSSTGMYINSTGFLVGNNYWGPNVDMIYIAIRRGPMKTPTTGTSVFSPVARTGTSTNPTVVTTNNNPDLLMSFPRTASPAAYGMCFWDKLRGISPMLQSATTGAEISTNTTRVLQGWLNTGYQAGADFAEGYLNYSGSDYVNYPITRAPGFFDVVCFTAGTSTNRRVDHNLTTPPQLILLKARNVAQSWYAYSETLGINGILYPNQNWAPGTVTNAWGSSAPTATNFGINEPTFASAGDTYVAYLFASCPGVSKVGSYTGNGSSQTINCGFTGGARFVMVKRTDSTGNWMVVDTARGLVSASDPTLYLNSTAAEVTGVDWLDPDSSGFIVNQESTMNANVNGATYIYLAIA